MPRNKDEPPTIRVYTVYDESRSKALDPHSTQIHCCPHCSNLWYLIVKNVPALGCGEELSKLFVSYVPVEEFAKRRLDDFVFIGNQLQVSYAPQFESLSDTKEKLEGRKKKVLARVKLSQNSTVPQISSSSHGLHSLTQQLPVQAQSFPKQTPLRHRDFEGTPFSHVSSNKDYFPSPSMNKIV